MYEPRRRNIALRASFFEHLPAKMIKERKEEDPSFLTAWEQTVELAFQITQDSTVQNLTIDTVDICYEACQEYYCWVHGVNNPSDKKDFGATWNEIKFAFTTLFNKVIASGKSVLFISHAKEREQELQELADGVSMVGPSCSSSALKIMKQMCDFWFYYGYNEGKRVIILRDPERNVDVSTGIGFMDENKRPLNKIIIPNDPTKFYTTVNNAFLGKVAGPSIKHTAKPVLKKK